ncbi:MAG TPA: sigma-70 family RNA polymerase sigma factor [Syntrophothermus lipocalidus]|nr:sigma-70 family RNA polymerase sigma factor [Syntrophothermus lipocalidus]
MTAARSRSEQEKTLKQIREAQDGNTQARELLISQHLGFIKALVLKNVASNEDIINRDEYSVALIAFNEAISSYKPGLRSFQSFAADVIKRRLIDYRRSTEKHRKRIIYVDDISNPLPDQDALVNGEELEIRMEMKDFVQKLAQYGVSLRDLVQVTPKHLDSRRLCAQLAQTIADSPDMRDYFIRYGAIPVQQLSEASGISPKTVKRHRKYIIALCLVLLSDLETMKRYVKGLGKGSDAHA